MDTHENHCATSTTHWDGKDRRGGGNLYIELLTETNHRLEELTKRMEENTARFEAHARGEEALLKTMTDAFPDGDAHGHREYHEAVMRNLQRREKFRDAVIEKSLSSLVWLAIAGVGTAIWTSFKDHLK